MSKKPISIKDKPSKKVLLDELESIKHLLDNEDSEFEPPLLTQEVSKGQKSPDHSHLAADFDDDFPVLTDSLDEDNIPTLQADFEDNLELEDIDMAEAAGHIETMEEEENDDDDIVSRAIKAQARLNSQAAAQPPIQPSPQAEKSLQDTTAPKPKSLFDDNALDDELSPEMLALSAKPANKPKPVAPKQEDTPKPAEAKKVMPTKPEPKKFLSLEEELNELSKNMVDETPTDDTLDDAETNEILEEFDDYLEEDYLSDDETLEDAPPKNESDEAPEDFTSEISIDENAELNNQTDSSLLDVDPSTEDDIELEAFADFEEKESINDDSLLAAAILEVTDSLSDVKLSEQIQESLTKDDSNTDPSALVIPPKEHQPSLFDSVSSDEEIEHKKSANKPTEVASSPVKIDKNTGEKITRTASTTAKTPLSKPTTPTNKPKTENPFLPKHIRDRLHTKRTLQQEIDDSSTHSFSRIPSNTISNTESNTGIQEPISAPVANSTSKPPLPSHIKMTSEEDRVVEEVMGSVLPKIESELRQKIRELIKQEKSSE